MQSFRSSLLSFIRSLATLYAPLSWMWPKNALNIKYLFAFQWKMQWIDDINPLLLLRKNIKHCCVICSSSHGFALFHHVVLQQPLTEISILFPLHLSVLKKRGKIQQAVCLWYGRRHPCRCCYLMLSCILFSFRISVSIALYVLTYALHTMYSGS